MIPQLARPRARLLFADGGAVATRVHYETLNDAMFLVRVTGLAAVLSLASVVLLSLATANVDLALGIQAVAAYPRLVFSAAVWTSTSVFSAILVAWFVVFCVLSHVMRLHFNTTDPPRDWDDRNGAWSVVELDVRTRAKREPHESLAAAEEMEAAAEAAAAVPRADAWRLCVQPGAEAGLLTRDGAYAEYRARHRKAARASD
ncbi:hypothetical protein GGF46_001138 [Coemansia sp. RSA 552]|nr:hypothetical protein GGF46_001138 [Coemansia sp. RSA 552]